MYKTRLNQSNGSHRPQPQANEGGVEFTDQWAKLVVIISTWHYGNIQSYVCQDKNQTILTSKLAFDI